MNLDQQRELISIYKQYQETNTNIIKANIAAKMQELASLRQP